MDSLGHVTVRGSEFREVLDSGSRVSDSSLLT